MAFNISDPGNQNSRLHPMLPVAAAVESDAGALHLAGRRADVASNAKHTRVIYDNDYDV